MSTHTQARDIAHGCSACAWWLGLLAACPSGIAPGFDAEGAWDASLSTLARDADGDGLSASHASAGASSSSAGGLASSASDTRGDAGRGPAASGCDSGSCAPSACSDGVRGGAEVGVDCGGVCRACSSCAEILGGNPAAGTGVYSIDPDGAGPGAAFAVVCDMAHHGGGWTQIARYGRSLHHAQVTSAFDSDLLTENVAARLDGPGTTEYSHFDLRRFDAYGSRWTIRANVDVHHDGSQFQYAFYRPRPHSACTPGQAGANWIGSDVPQRLLFLATSSVATIPNHSWIPSGPIDLPADTGIFFLGFRRNSGPTRDCVGVDGQTLPCHVPPGTVSDQLWLGDPEVTFHFGVYTGAHGVGDNVPHLYNRGATYWLKAVNADGAP